MFVIYSNECLWVKCEFSFLISLWESFNRLRKCALSSCSVWSLKHWSFFARLILFPWIHVISSIHMWFSIGWPYGMEWNGFFFYFRREWSFRSSLIKIKINWKGVLFSIFFRKGCKTTPFHAKCLRACEWSVWIRKNRGKKG